MVCYDALTLTDLTFWEGHYNITWSTGDTSLQIVVGSGAYQVQVTDTMDALLARVLQLVNLDS